MRNSGEYTVYRWALAIFYIWVLLEGALRKWFLNSLATPLFFGKYVLIILILVILFIDRFKVSKKDYPFGGFLFFFIFYGIVQIFNLRVTDTIILGIIGNVLHFGFITVIFVVPLALSNVNNLNKLFRFINFLLLGIFLLGVIQYFSPPMSFINRYVAEVDDSKMALVGDHVRITTLFSYIATYASFLGLMVPLLFFQVVQIKKINLQSLLLLAIFFLGIINTLMSGSRGLVFMILGEILLAFFIYALQVKNGKLIKLGINFLLVISLGYIVLSFTEQGSTAFKAFAGRVENNSDVEGRILDAIDPFKFSKTSGLIGFGIGTTYQGNGRFITQRWKMPYFWEEESERILIELGIIGFIISFLFRIYIFSYSIKTYKTTRNGYYKTLALVLTVYQIPTVLYLNQVTFNWMENLMYFTAVGLLVFINKSERSEKVDIKENNSIAAG